jgi:hypothetical protein
MLRSLAVIGVVTASIRPHLLLSVKGHASTVTMGFTVGSQDLNMDLIFACNARSVLGMLTVSDCHCEAGYFKEDSQCQACGLGYFRTLTDSEQSCVACDAGLTTLQNASNSSEMCVQCADGHFISESRECVPCPAHASSVAVGQCQCNAGYTGQTGQTGQSQDNCTPCAAGSFKTLPGNHACTSCPAGTQGSGTEGGVISNGSCVECAAGTFWVSEESGCQPCVNNSFSTAGAIGNCSCNAGYFAAAQACYACATGTYKDFSGNSECMPCSGAYYNPYTAATVCIACTANSSGGAVNTVDSDCVCNRGFTGPFGGPCVQCALGKFKTASGSVACSECPAGASFPQNTPPDGNYCEACVENSAAAQENGYSPTCACNHGFVRRNGTCTACAAGFYCPQQYTEHACPLHTFSKAGAWELKQCYCVSGFYGELGNCSICPVDHYCESTSDSIIASNVLPTLCTTNSTTLGKSGSTSSINCSCVAGFFKNADGLCVPCEIGSFCAENFCVITSNFFNLYDKSPETPWKLLPLILNTVIE